MVAVSGLCWREVLARVHACTHAPLLILAQTFKTDMRPPPTMIRWCDGIDKLPDGSPCRQLPQKHVWSSTVWVNPNGVLWRRFYNPITRACTCATARVEPAPRGWSERACTSRWATRAARRASERSRASGRATSRAAGERVLDDHGSSRRESSTNNTWQAAGPRPPKERHGPTEEKKVTGKRADAAGQLCARSLVQHPNRARIGSCGAEGDFG